MAPGTRCDEILRLIDEVLEEGAGAACDDRPATSPHRPLPVPAAAATVGALRAARPPTAASRRRA